MEEFSIGGVPVAVLPGLIVVLGVLLAGSLVLGIAGTSVVSLLMRLLG